MKLVRDKCILIVEDDQMMLSYLSLCLKGAGLDTLGAANDEAALELLRGMDLDDLPRIIVVSGTQSQLDGDFFEALEYMKYPAATKIIIFTAALVSPVVTFYGRTIPVLKKLEDLDKLIDILRQATFSSSSDLAVNQ